MDQPRLDDMRLFAQLADSGSLTAAAQALGISKQTLSRRLAELEDSLGVELARRSTRSLVLTEVGQAYAKRCLELVRLADQANRLAAAELSSVSGRLRITADSSFGEAFLPELVAEFLELYPELCIEVELSSRKVDLLEEGFDLAFRIGPPPDKAHLAATRLAPAELWMVASPNYVQDHGQPTKLAELAEHQLLAAVPSLQHHAWPVADKGQLRMQTIEARVRVNGLSMARHCARAGLGIAQLPSFAVAEDLRRGSLVRVLAQHSPEVGGLHLVYPHTGLLPPKVKAFVLACRARFRGSPSEN